MDMPSKWEKRFYSLALEVASWSKDPSVKVGAVIVSQDRRNITVGYNGFPVRIADSIDRLSDKNLKRSLTVHAELNALHNATTNVRGYSMIVTRPPCSRCALSIIQARIAKLIIPRLDSESNWYEESLLAIELLNEAQVQIDWIDT